MRLTKSIGDSTFNISTHYEDVGDENPGYCNWVFKAEYLKAVLAKFDSLHNDFSIMEAIGNFIENNNEFEASGLADLPDDCEISIQDADAGIKIVAALGTIPGEYNISWHGENNYWFFHDWQHVLNDTEINIYPDYTKNLIEIRVDGHNEERAHIEGAKDAIRNGCDISDVIEAINSVMREFESRFKYSISKIWGQIFNKFKIQEVV
mgnify:CR=1 FL=1